MFPKTRFLKNLSSLKKYPVVVVVVVATRPLPRDEGMAEDHGDPKAGHLSNACYKGCRETESNQRVSGAKSP